MNETTVKTAPKVMTPERIRNLGHELTEYAKNFENGEQMMADPIWWALQKLVPWPAVELIVRRERREKEILLIHRQDKYWNGFGLPGGFMRWGESIEEACERIAQREIGLAVDVVKEAGIFTWGSRHPYGAPISILCYCRIGYKEEPNSGEFFSIDKLPENVLPEHRRFLRETLHI